MFRSTRANARRISLLASSSFVASTVLAGAGGMALTAFTPSVALAATCTPQTEGTYTVPVGSTGGTIVCGPGPAASIGFTSNTAGTNIYMTGNLVVNDGGVLLTSTTAQNLAVVEAPTTVLTGGYIAPGASTAEDGIHVISAGGNVTVNNGTAANPIAVTGNFQGIYAKSTGAGSVTVTAAANVTGVKYNAIGAVTGTGAASVTIDAGVVAAGGPSGSGVTVEGGAVTLVDNGAITSSADHGVFARGATVSVSGAGAITNTGAGNGLYASSGAGLATVDTSGAIAGGTAGTGMSVNSGGGITGAVTGAVTGDAAINLTDNSATGIAWTQGGNVTGTNGGLLSTELGAGPNAITINNGAVVTGGTGTGVGVYAGTGAASLTTTAGATISGATGAKVTGSGPITVDTSAGGLVTGTAGDGLDVTSTGNGVVGVATAAVTGSAAGVVVTNSGTGATTINTDGVVTGGTGAGVSATSTNIAAALLTVNANANVTGAKGVVATSAGSGVSVSVNNGSTITSTAGVGVGAYVTGTFGNALAKVALNGGASVVAAGGDGVLASSTSGANNDTVTAQVVVGGTGGAVTVTGTGGQTGIEALANQTFGGGSALVDLSGNTGLTVTVGATGGGGDTGILANATDDAGPEFAQVKLGGTQTVTVGNGTAFNLVGVAAHTDSLTNPSATPTAVIGASGDNITVNGTFSIGVEATSSVDNVGVSFGGGNVGSVTVNSGYGSIGVLARTGGAGTSSVSLGTTSVTDTGGIGVESITTDGANLVNLGGANVTTNYGAGVLAKSYGAGNITVTDGQTAPTAAFINATGGYSSGIVAYSDTAGTGGVTVNFHGTVGKAAPVANVGIDAQILNAADTQNITVNAANINSTKEGIFAQTRGAGAVTITTDHGTSITTTNNDGIDAFALGGGNVTVTLLDGSITSNTSGSGALSHGGSGVVGLDPHAVHAQITNGTNSSTGQTNLDLQSNLTNTGPGAAVLSTTEDGVNFVHLDNVGGNNPVITQTGPGDGIEAYSTGNGLVVSNTNTSGGTPLAAGLYGVHVVADAGTQILADTSDGIDAFYRPTVAGSGVAGQDVVTVTDHGKIGSSTLFGDATSAAVGYNGITAGVYNSGVGNIVVQGGDINATYNGIYAQHYGKGNITVGTDAGTTILAKNNDGIFAYHDGTSGNIVVTALGNIGTGTAFVGHDGVYAGIYNAANPGSVTVSAEGNINASHNGIFAQTLGVGSGAVAKNAGVTVNFGDTATSNVALTSSSTGIVAQIANAAGANNDNVFVTVGSAGANTVGVTALSGDGVDATTNGSGNVAVTEAANGTITSNLGNGISATNTGGVNGAVLVTVNGTVTGKLDGVLAQNNILNNDDVTVDVGAGGVVNGAGGGIVAVNLGDTILNGFGAVTVNNQGTVNSANGVGIDAVIGGAYNNHDVTVTSGTVTAGTTGIFAQTDGTGDVTVTTLAGTTVTGVTGDGVEALQFGGGAGAVTVTNLGAVTAALDAILASDAGSGPVAVTTGAGAITGAGLMGVAALSTGGGAVTVQGGTGTITGASFGVDAETSGGANSGAILVNLAGNVVATGTGGVGVDANTHGGAGAITLITQGVTANGGTNSIGVDATTSGGNGNVSVTTNGVVSGSGDGIDATTGGTGSVTVLAKQSVTGTNGSGIHALSSTGGTNVTADGAVAGGTVGIFANSTGPTTIVANGPVTASAGNGISAGGSVVSITANGAVTGTGGNGVYSSSVGNISVTTVGPVSGTGAGDSGIHVFSTTGGNVSVTADSSVAGVADGILTSTTLAGTQTISAAGGNVTASAGDGIHATTTGSGAIGVTTGSPTLHTSVTGTGGNGIFLGSTGGSNITLTLDSNVAGTAGAGINVSTTGAGAIDVNDDRNFYDAVSGSAGGILATTTGSGPVTVSQFGPVSGGTGRGIDAESGSGNVGVDVDGAITATTDGIFASTGGTGTIKIGLGFGDTFGSIAGVTGAGSAGIDAENAGSGATTIRNDMNLTGIAGADFGIAVNATAAGSGTISIVNFQSIGAAGAGNGVNVAGIWAKTSSNAANAIAIDNYGAISVNTSATPNYDIFAEDTGAGAVSVTNSGALDPAAFGIYAKSGGNVLVTNSGPITAGQGIFADTTGATSTVTVNNLVGGTILATGPTGNGIGTYADAGATTITNAAAITATGVGGDGIRARSLSGPITVSTSGSITAGSDGIDVRSYGGSAVSVTTSGGATITAAGYGVFAYSFGGPVNVDTTGGAVSTTGNVGVEGYSYGAGAVTVATGSVSQSGKNLYSAAVEGHSHGGNVAITTGGTGIGSTIVGYSAGIVGQAQTAGTVTITTHPNPTAGTGAVTATATGAAGTLTLGGVTASNGVGIAAYGVGGVTIVSNTPVTAASAGIVGVSGAAGAVNITSNGAVTANGAATLNGGAGPVGIEAVSGTGGFAAGTGTSLVLAVNGDVTAANGRAIVTSAGNDAAISIGPTATVTGLGTATPAFGGTSTTTTNAVVDLTTAAGATTSLTNFGTITSASASPANLGDLAVRGTGGSVVLNNGGLVDGRMDFSGLGATSAVTVNNGVSTSTGTGTATVNVLANGDWQTTGTSVLAPGAVVTNGATSAAGTATGLIGTANNGLVTTIAFGGGASVLDNTASGTIVAGEGTIPGAVKAGTEATPAVTSFTGLATFTNNGLIVLGGTAAGSDGLIDSVLNASGAAFGGTGTIDLDANLAGATQSAGACTGASLTAADCLVVGSTSGNNAIRVTDTGAAAVGVFNPTGIVIVAGSSSATSFHLASGSSFFNAGGVNEFGGATNVLDKPGLFFYDLAYDAADHTERLIGVPKAEAFEFASLGGAASDLWYATTQTWFDRNADLRDAIVGRESGAKPGVWLKMTGDWSRRTGHSSFTDLNKTYTFDSSYNQDTAALIGGVDLLDVTGDRMAFVAGLEAGGIDSNVAFRSSPDRYHLTGTDFGGYATYLAGPLFIDGTINANILNMTSSLPNVQTTPSPSTGVHSVGGQVEAGLDLPVGAMAFVEPLGSVSYVNTTFGDLAVPGGTETLGHDNSLRASLGGRVGADATYQYYRVRVALEGRAWDEFENDARSSLLIPGGVDFLNSDRLRGVFGEVKGEANIFSNTSGVSAFVTGGWKFKSNYSEGTVTVGARYQW